MGESADKTPTKNPTLLEDAASSNNNSTNDIDSNGGASFYKDHVPVFLPTLEVQYVCDEDIRHGFNTNHTFEELYQSLLPDMAEPHLTTTERISGMDQILKAYGRKKLKIWGCNTTSTRVLMTFKVKAFAFFERSSPDIAQMENLVNADAVQDYFATNICTSNMTEFKVFVENPFRKEFQSNEFDQVQHNVNLLCPDSGASYYVDYDDPNGDPIFVLFGIFVGYYMLRMILVELKKYGRNRRRGGNNNQQQYEELSTSYEEEVEMM